MIWEYTQDTVQDEAKSLLKAINDVITPCNDIQQYPSQEEGKPPINQQTTSTNTPTNVPTPEPTNRPTTQPTSNPTSSQSPTTTITEQEPTSTNNPTIPSVNDLDVVTFWPAQIAKTPTAIWDSGFCLNIQLTNPTDRHASSWNLLLSLSEGTRMTGEPWNGVLSPSQSSDDGGELSLMLIPPAWRTGCLEPRGSCVIGFCGSGPVEGVNVQEAILLA